MRAAVAKPDMDWYELRHFCGSRMGMTPYDIAIQLGHEDGGKPAMKTHIHTPAEEPAKGYGERSVRTS